MADSKAFANEVGRIAGEALWVDPRQLEKSPPRDSVDDALPWKLLRLALGQPDLESADFFAAEPALLADLEILECQPGSLGSEQSSWLAQLPALRVAIFHGQVDPTCLVALQRAPHLQHLTLVGNRISEAHLSALMGLSGFHSLVLVNCEADPEALSGLRRRTSGAVLAYDWEYDQKFEPLLPPAPLRSTPSQEVTEVETALADLHAALATRDPRPTNKFSPPLTVEAKVALERTLGFRLPEEAAALLARHAGQPDWQDGLLCLAPFLEPKEILCRFRFQLECTWDECHWFCYRDSDATYHRLLLPLMGADANSVHLDLVTGQVIETGNIGGEVIATTLGDFLQRLAREVASGPATTTPEGRLELQARVSDLRDESLPAFSP